MPKKLALKQRIHHRRAVADGQLLLAHRTNVVNGPRHQLFSRSGGSYQQHVGVMPRHFPREIEDFQHDRAFSDDPVKLQILQQLFFERAHPFALVINRRYFVQSSLQANTVDGFGQKIRRAPANGIQRRFQRVFAGHHDHVNPGVAAQCAIEKFITVHAGHIYVGQYQPAAASSHQAQRLFGVRRCDSFVAHLIHRCGQQVQLGMIIIQNARRQRRLCCRQLDRLAICVCHTNTLATFVPSLHLSCVSCSLAPATTPRARKSDTSKRINDLAPRTAAKLI